MRRSLKAIPGWILACMAAGFAVPAQGADPTAPSLGLPIRCEIGTDCFIQNHVDTDPGPGFRDFACGTLGYDGDTGTDFRLPNLAAMRRGVAVIAAAPGRVRAIREGVEDTGIPKEGVEALAGKFAGNAVVLQHGDGWETQYSHLRKGSITVRTGDEVARGQVLGLVGLSGRTQFPHVEMIVRRNGTPLDPFLGPAGFKGCGAKREPLWTAGVDAALGYRPGGVLQAGFAGEVPPDDRVRDGDFAPFAPTRASVRLVLWGEFFGLKGGDRVNLVVEGPGGRRWFDQEASIERVRAVAIYSAPVTAPTDGFPAGRYVGTLRIKREGRIVAEARREIDVGS